MKKIVTVLLSVTLIFCSTAAFAVDTKVTLGLKAWANSWDETIDYIDGTSNSYDMGSAFMLGPSLNVKLGKVFLGATYLKSMSDYEAKDWSYPGSGDTMTFERKDLDITLGVMFVPYFGMFVGYKTVDAPATYSDPFYGITNESVGTWKLKGPGIGILGNIPLGRAAAIYGNLAFLSLKQEFALSGGSTVPSYDLTGIAGEVGVAFAFTESLSANIGFKAQSFSGDNEAGDTVDDTFKGLTLGLNYSF